MISYWSWWLQGRMVYWFHCKTLIRDVTLLGLNQECTTHNSRAEQSWTNQCRHPTGSHQEAPFPPPPATIEFISHCTVTIAHCAASKRSVDYNTDHVTATVAMSAIKSVCYKADRIINLQTSRITIGVFLIPSGRPSRILNLYWTKWALAFVLVSSFLYFFLAIRVLD